MAFLRKGEKAAKHKYVARVRLKHPTEDKQYRYFYTKEAYIAYLNANKKEVQIASSPISENISKLLSKQQDTQVLGLKDLKKTIFDKYKNVDKPSDDTEGLKDLKKTIFDNIKNVDKPSDDTDKKDKTESKIRKYLDEFGNKTLEKTDKVKEKIIPIIESAIKGLDDRNLKSFDDVKKKDREYSNQEDQAAVNPNFEKGLAYQMNCIWCTAAYDLRKRGYDVEAGPDKDGEPIESVLSWYKNPTLVSAYDVAMDKYSKGLLKDSDTYSSVLEQDMLKHGEGARGHFIVEWTQGGAHDMVWSNENGNVVIRDCQSNTTYRIKDLENYITPNMYYIRTDNIEPTEEVLKNMRNKRRKR